MAQLDLVSSADAFPDDALQVAELASNIPKYVGEVVAGGVDNINAALDKLTKASTVVSKQLTEIVSFSHEELLKEASIISSIPVLLNQASKSLENMLMMLQRLQETFPARQEEFRQSLSRWRSLIATLHLLYQAQCVVKRLAQIEGSEEMSETVKMDLASLPAQKCRQIAASLEKTLEQLADETVRSSLLKITRLKEPIQALMSKSSELRKIGSQLCRPFAENTSNVSVISPKEIQDLRCGLHILYYVKALTEELTLLHTTILQPLHLELSSGPLRNASAIASKILQKGIILDHAVHDIYEGKTVLKRLSSEQTLWKEVLTLYTNAVNKTTNQFIFNEIRQVWDLLEFEIIVRITNEELLRMMPSGATPPNLHVDPKRIQDALKFTWKELTQTLGLMFPHCTYLLEHVQYDSSATDLDEQCALACKSCTMLRNLPTKKDMQRLTSQYTAVYFFPKGPSVRRLVYNLDRLIVACFQTSFPSTQDKILNTDGSLKPSNRVQASIIKSYQLVDQLISALEQAFFPHPGQYSILKDFRSSLLLPWLQEVAELVLVCAKKAMSGVQSESELIQSIEACQQVVQQLFGTLLQPLLSMPHFVSMAQDSQIRCLRTISLSWMRCEMAMGSHEVQQSCMSSIISLLRSMVPKGARSGFNPEFDVLEDLLRLTCEDTSIVPTYYEEGRAEEPAAALLRNPSRIRLEVVAYALLWRLVPQMRADHTLIDLSKQHVSILRPDLLPNESLASSEFREALEIFSSEIQRDVMRLIRDNETKLQTLINSSHVSQDEGERFANKAAKFLLKEYLVVPEASATTSSS